MAAARSLVIFDVDGTLCETTAVDDECYIRACEEFFQIRVAELDWSASAEVTDTGVLHWFCEKLGKAPPSPADVERVRGRFLGLLEGAHARCPSLFAAKAGARALLPELLVTDRVVGIATGGWGKTARFKLRAAGLPESLLVASSDDSRSRVEIFRLAAERLAGGAGRPENVTLVGDGVWDVRVAKQLGFSFVGVAVDARADKLRAEGAEHVVPDFSDVARLTRLLA
jgi:phosphoglycolate phosphatase-like HAD superfamily hydrolase